MSVCTLGLYELYWSYQQWKRIRDREREDLSPFWRAVFSTLWMFSLLPRVQDYAQSRQVSAGWNASLLALLHLLIQVTWRMPDPWWLISLLTFVPLLPAVRTIRDLHEASKSQESSNASFSKSEVAVCVVGGLVLALAIIGTFLPPEDVGDPSGAPMQVAGR